MAIWAPSSQHRLLLLPLLLLMPLLLLSLLLRCLLPLLPRGSGTPLPPRLAGAWPTPLRNLPSKSTKNQEMNTTPLLLLPPPLLPLLLVHPVLELPLLLLLLPRVLLLLLGLLDLWGSEPHVDLLSVRLPPPPGPCLRTGR